MTLLVLAAGMGSRYGGLKQIEPLGPSGETLLDYSVSDALRAGFDRLVFVIRRDFEQTFRESVGARYERLVAVDYAFQSLDDVPSGFALPPERTKPWGTGHAILAARHAVNAPFLAINADDFYGREAYAQIAKHFTVSSDCAMAGYRLDKTLSPHGTVSRGICETDSSNNLLRVQEYTHLAPSGHGICDQVSGRSFLGDEPVSLNFWGLTPDIFPKLESLFPKFLDAHGHEEKSEFYIPSAIADLIASNELRVKVLPTEAEWFGVTYREDKPAVQARLAAIGCCAR